jgi:HlyD family secretion protein
MENKVFPQSVLNESIEVYDARISARSHVVFIVLLTLVISLIISLPFVEVDVAVQSPGKFQSSLQRNPILNTVTGRLEMWNFSENRKVEKGELLAVIRGERINLERKSLQERLTLLHGYVADLIVLVDAEFSDPVFSEPKTNFYQASMFEFQTRLMNKKMLVEKVNRDYQRAKTLFESQSIAFADFDETKIRYEQEINEFDLLKKHQVNQWEQDLARYGEEIARVNSQLQASLEELDQYKIVAGTSGTLMNVLNLNVGDFVSPNLKLAEISPDTSIFAVTYLSPQDIAFLSEGQEVKFQVDAFNYNQWGVAEGKILQIADDLTMVSEREAGFLVTCRLDSDFLALPTGQKGEIKKGMTFSARFIVARRTLYQLLYDKVDDWLNPATGQTKLFENGN